MVRNLVDGVLIKTGRRATCGGGWCYTDREECNLWRGVGVIQTGRSATCGGGLVLYRQTGVNQAEVHNAQSLQYTAIL